jgi:hypothetical protein
MAEKPTKKPVGMAKNVPLRLDGHVIPTDFIILDLPEDENLSIILGRPFLNTAGASLDCSEGKVTFRICEEEIVKYFPKKPGARVKYVPPPKRLCTVSRENPRPPDT